MRVMLIEDNPDDVRLAQEALNQAGHPIQLRHFRRLSDALEFLRRHGDAFDVALLDLNLPDAAGLESVQRLQIAAAGMAVVVLSGNDDSALAVSALREGAQDYLVKGEYSPMVLERSLRYAVERKRLTEALRESEERMSLAMHGSRDVIWDWDLKRERLYVSPQVQAVLGYSPLDFVDPPAYRRAVHLDDIERMQTGLQNHIAGRAPNFQEQIRLQHRNGGYRWFLMRGLAVRDGNGHAHRVAGSLTDITDLAAYYDSVTNLPSRALFLDRLRAAIAHARKFNTQAGAVLFVRLDRYGAITQTLGDAAGDRLIAECARRIEVQLRPGDVLARVASRELAIFSGATPLLNDALTLARTICAKLEEPFDIGDECVFPEPRIGLVIVDCEYDGAEDALRDAGVANERAGAGDDTRIQVFDTHMQNRATQRFRMENDLRQAIPRRQLFLCYQPIVDLVDGRMLGLEALLRWRHPDHGMVPPDEFIPMAEEAGLIGTIGWWVMREAVRQLKSWSVSQADKDFYVSVNVSGRQLTAGASGRIAGVLREFGISARRLRIEITESVLMDRAVEPVLEQVAALGVQLCLDDFGTGYSSLGYLNRFPFSCLKIDRSFLGGTDKWQATPLLRAVTGMAQDLGLAAIAEGVETAEQHAKLRELGCPAGQGYFFARPMPGSDIDRWLESNARGQRELIG